MVRLEVPGHVLQHFWDLANVEAETRQTSAVRLVHELKSAQDAFSVSGAVSDAEMGDAADVGGRLAGDGSGDENEAPPSLTGCSPVLVYALRRLARGLGSGRSGARQGFALALTAAFSEIPLVSLPDGLKLLKTSLDPITQATKGSEARDILMGQLFGVAALVRAMAPRLAAGEIGRKEAVDFAAAVAEEVSALAAAKAYLAESASAVILEIADALGGAEAAGAGGDVTAVLERAASLADWIAAPAADATPESLALAAQLWPALPPALRARCDVLPPASPEETAAAAAVAAVMEKIQKGKGGGKKKGGEPQLPEARRVAAAARWRSFFRTSHLEKVRDALAASSRAHPQTHTVWVLLMDAARTHAIPGALEALWETQVERGLMTSGSHQRRFLGFRLFASLLTRADAALVPALFSDGFSRCLLNNLAKKDNYLHATADDCLAHVLKHAKARDTPPDVRLAVAAALQRLGPHRLDASGDKKNAVRELLGGLTGDDASEHARELMRIFARAPEADGAEAAEPGDGDGDAPSAAARNKRRLWALEQAVGLWPRLPRETQRELLEFLVAHAYYREEDAGVSEKPRKGEKKKAGGGKKEASVLLRVGVAPLAAPVDGLREACAVRASALLAANVKARRAAAVAAAKAAAEPKEKQERVPADPPPDLLAAAAALCRELGAPGSGAALVDDMPEECAAVRASLFSALDTLAALEAKAAKARKEDAGDASPALAVAPLLRALAVLQVSDWREFTPAIEDLPRCVDDLLAPPKAKAKKKKKKNAPNAEDADPKDPKDPEPMDVLVDILLSLLAQPSALLRDVVEHVFKSVSGSVSEASVRDMLRVVLAPDADSRNAAAGDGGSDDEAPLEDEDDGEEEEDEDEDEEAGSDDDDDDESDDESDDDAESDEDADSDSDDGPVDETRAAAIAAALAKSGANIDSDEEEDPAEDMDDEAMFSIDALLGQAFKSRRNDIKRKKSMVRATRDFKFRVLALLELYARAQPASPWLPGAALPLLGAMQTALAAGTPQASALAERVGGVLVKHVCRARDVPTDAGVEPVTVETIAASLAASIRAASRPSGGGDAKGFAKPATAVSLYLLRVLEALEARACAARGAGRGWTRRGAGGGARRRRRVRGGAEGVQDEQAVSSEGPFLPGGVRPPPEPRCRASPRARTPRERRRGQAGRARRVCARRGAQAARRRARARAPAEPRGRRLRAEAQEGAGERDHRGDRRALPQPRRQGGHREARAAVPGGDGEAGAGGHAVGGLRGRRRGGGGGGDAVPRARHAAQGRGRAHARLHAPGQGGAAGDARGGAGGAAGSRGEEARREGWRAARRRGRRREKEKEKKSRRRGGDEINEVDKVQGGEARGAHLGGGRGREALEEEAAQGQGAARG
jgi:DNA polymerase phi